MFKEIREQVNLLDAIHRYTGQELVQAGSETLQLEDKTCPFPDCGHSDCFKVKQTDEGSFFKCFSCGEAGRDAISFYMLLKKVDAYTAGRQIAKDYGIRIETEAMTSHQRIFEVAARFFHECLMNSTDRITVKDKSYTPLEYQLQVRRHSQQTLEEQLIGWNNGHLIPYLQTFDFSDEDIISSGLGKINSLGNLDSYLAKNCYIYPHFVRGRVSHFTQKDPLKIIAPYQIKVDQRLNDHLFYGQDLFRKSKEVWVVEGENDLLTMLECDPNIGVICVNGSISKKQLEWIEENSKDKTILTIFDSDDAGDLYRKKFFKSKIKDLKQYRIPADCDAKDIDDFLKKVEGASLRQLEYVPDPASVPVEGAKVIEGHEIFEYNGCYCKSKTNAEGERTTVRITNFVIRLKNIYIRDEMRTREVVVETVNGVISSPFLVSSDMKVSLKAFREAVADAADVSFYGSEADLTTMWEFVYAQKQNRIVHLPREIGHLENNRGWLFRDCFINANGVVIPPDEEGVMWVSGNTFGIKPASLDSKVSAGQDASDIPTILTKLTEPDRRRLIGQVIQAFTDNLGSVGTATTILAWSMANAYSDFIFKRFNFFPFLYMWGKHAGGKTTLAKWVLALYGMDEFGTTSIPQLSSGAGVRRQMSYFASLPMYIDEVRADQETKNHYGLFRAWYNRHGRTMGSKDSSEGVVYQKVKSNILFTGQDVFTDAATRSRCIEIQINANGREMEKSYLFMETHLDELKACGFQWILDSADENIPLLYDEMSAAEKQIMANTFCNNRDAKHWSIIMVLGCRLLRQYGIKYDFPQFIYETCRKGMEQKNDDDIVMRVMSSIEGLQVGEKSPLSGEHIKNDNGLVYIWFSEVLQLVRKNAPAALLEGERFSKTGILENIREEPYFLGETRIEMGPKKIRRRVLAFDLSKSPEVLKNISKFAESY